VEISTVDVAAASARGILVTQAAPGFVDTVVELGVGFMVDLAQGVSRSVQEYWGGGVAHPRPGLQLSGSTLAPVGYGRMRGASPNWQGRWECRCWPSIRIASLTR